MEPRPYPVSGDARARFPDFFAEHRRGSKFFTPWAGGELPGFSDMLRWQFGTNPWRAEKRADEPPEPDREGLDRFLESDVSAGVVWLGQAGFLAVLDGFRFLIDPVYGTVGAFVKRLSAEPFPLDRLPPIDAVFLSHGHYDHLDVQTLRAIAELSPNARFCVPLGQRRYLPTACRDVVELDWWQALDFPGPVEAVFVPAQHWHRRGPFDQNAALWGGWMFRGSRTLFHSGDSGYCGVFELLGTMFDVDLAMLPVGAYEPRWFMKTQHMNPEESLQSFHDLGASRFVAMHWGTYDLTDEPPTLGAREIERLAAEAGVRGQVFVPRPGGFTSVP